MKSAYCIFNEKNNRGNAILRCVMSLNNKIDIIWRNGCLNFFWRMMGV